VDISGKTAIVTGGGSGLGAATARALAERGARVAVFDFNLEAGQALAEEIGGAAFGVDVSDPASVETAVRATTEALGAPRILINCAGIAPAKKVLGKSGTMPLDDFRRAVEVNLIGTFNTLRLFAGVCSELEAVESGERGVIINTASIAAYEGQIGQTAYASSKAGVIGLTLPAAREFAPLGIRVCTIAPGIFETAMLKGLPEAAQQVLGASIPFPSRLGMPQEYASLALHIIGNVMLNGETIRLDGALRMPPK
jgi:NAD(P)-dependent dehydrogenase (short-subunit alcohol dehydrogenase family)